MIGHYQKRAHLYLALVLFLLSEYLLLVLLLNQLKQMQPSTLLQKKMYCHYSQNDNVNTDIAYLPSTGLFLDIVKRFRGNVTYDDPNLMYDTTHKGQHREP